ncbi:hypothetical protein E2P81_ATG00293 [Venturia nashicola]|uniref:Uncharacterized protein n=1 Tax=Venturia nashicola TaxID=86259 RepID=A0A4Z1PI34_9PEZI|nr:hypothetical protein E6O75_ATG00304 [Venturia nashicola]TLD39306.1 hypothetical protein E2P81_ATG00293 [Venturia nashicola]
MAGSGISRRVQDRIDAVFMPSGIRRSVEEIKEIRKAGQPMMPSTQCSFTLTILPNTLAASKLLNLG